MRLHDEQLGSPFQARPAARPSRHCARASRPPAGVETGRGSASGRPGFTLIELLVAITILMVISALTFTMVNVTMDRDRIRSGSREIQSFLEGARNQAVYAGQPRGVRFLLNPDDPTTCNSMVFIGPPTRFGDETTVGVSSGSDDLVEPAQWANLAARGLLLDGARIKIPADGGDWYTIARNPPNTGTWTLTKPYTGPAIPPDQPYLLELAPAVLPNQEPRLLPEGVVIDLDNSRLPASWSTAGGPPYSAQMDVLFSPRGTVIGPVGAAGRVHFVLSDVVDTNNNCPLPTNIPVWAAGTPYAQGAWVVSSTSNEIQFLCTAPGTSGGVEPPEFAAPVVGTTVADGGTVQWLTVARRRSLVVSLVTQTGNVASYPVHPTEPFRYAETGEVAQ